MHLFISIWNTHVQTTTLGRKTSVGIGLAFMALLIVPAAQSQDWKTYWKNGTRIESDDGKFKLRIGGRIQADLSAVSADSSLDEAFDLEGGSEFRRSRLFVDGKMLGHYEFKIQYDFAGSSTSAKDVYIGLTNLPGIGGLRFGHFKEPFSLGEITSSKHMTFLERALPVTAFAPSRNLGLMAHRSVSDDRVNWAVGAFQDSDGRGKSTGDEVNLSARLGGRLIWNDDGRELLHLGLSVATRSPTDDRVRFRTRPEAHLAPRFVDTSTLDASGAELLGLEFAWGLRSILGER